MANGVIPVTTSVTFRPVLPAIPDPDCKFPLVDIYPFSAPVPIFMERSFLHYVT
jgi:hypothetical protein